MKKSEATIQKLYSLEHTIAAPLLQKFEYPWEALREIHAFILELGPTLDPAEWNNPSENVWVHKSVKIINPMNYTIQGPAIIGAGTEIRPGAFIRKDVIIGENCVVGNSSEYKNVIIFDNVQTPHFNYLGDSIMGYKSHTGCQSLTSNVKSDKTLVKVHFDDGDVETGLKKFGAMIGDCVEVGCGAVMNPGTVIGKNAQIYPLSSVRGTVDAGSIYKKRGEIVAKEEQL